MNGSSSRDSIKAKLNEIDSGVDAVAEPLPMKRTCTREESTQKKVKGRAPQPRKK